MTITDELDWSQCNLRRANSNFTGADFTDAAFTGGLSPRDLAPTLAAIPATTPRPCRPFKGQYTRTENQRQGTPGLLSGTGPGVEVFLSTTFAACGRTVSVHASGVGEGILTVYRVGYYGGLGARSVHTKPLTLSPGSAVKTIVQGRNGTQRATYAAAFPKTASFDVHGDWVPGLYAVKVTGPSGGQIAWLAVPNRGGDEPVVMVLSMNTAQAYNTWGGASAYRSLVPGEDASNASYVIDHQRPLTANRIEERDWPIVAHLEANGVAAEVISDEMFHLHAGLLVGRRAVVFGAHAEYWDQAEWDQVNQASRAGTAVLNFGANQAYWRIRWEKAGRRFAIFRSHAADPLGGVRAQATFRFREVGQPEIALFGSMYGCLWGAGAATLPASSWLLGRWRSTFTGSSSAAVPLPALFLSKGIELNTPQRDVPAPAGTQRLNPTKIACTSGTKMPIWSLTYRPRTRSNGMVFDAGTMGWTVALGGASVAGAPKPTVREVRLLLALTRTVFTRALGFDPYQSRSTLSGVRLAANAVSEPGVPLNGPSLPAPAG